MNTISGYHRYFCLLILSFICTMAFSQVRLRYEENYTLTYDEAVLAYQELDEAYSEAKLLSYGSTDVGKPLHLFVISSSEIFDPEDLKDEGKSILLILNGIHPGESCGIDASIEFARDILGKKNGLYQHLDNTVLCIVPVYNIGGALNRSSYNRANMDPLIETGFRGNARNLDLNRDFVKLDSRNAWNFTEIFQQWGPHVFLDNHVTNGSDHQYTITLISGVKERMNPELGEFLDGVMRPALYSAMEKTPYEMIPYVANYKRSPDRGIVHLMESPRYSDGYTSLFNTLAFLNETHIYKPFPDQVKATYYLMKNLFEFTAENADQVIKLRRKADNELSSLKEYVLKWELDTTRVDELYFKGYAYKSRTSELTGLPLPYYDREEPWEKKIPYYKTYKPSLTVAVPDFFIIPQVWDEIIDRLELNRIEMERITEDTLMEVEVFYITDISYANRPYNGHFVHSNIRIRSERQEIQFYKGDVIIPLDQKGKRYLMETLDPRGDDSFMCWNFFDPVLDTREYADPSTFEKRAIKILSKDPELRSGFEKWKEENPGQAASNYAQIRYILSNSEWAEKTYRRYPVYRINKGN